MHFTHYRATANTVGSFTSSPDLFIAGERPLVIFWSDRIYRKRTDVHKHIVTREAHMRAFPVKIAMLSSKDLAITILRKGTLYLLKDNTHAVAPT